jgi:hypothetical protein
MKVNPERARLHLEALATWSELENAVAGVVAATLRNDGAAVEAARSKAHEILDHHVDTKIASIAAIREDMAKDFDR